MATYYSKLLSELLGKIPANANTVIEAGYTSGALSQAYKHINPNAQYIAIGTKSQEVSKIGSAIDTYIQGCLETLDSTKTQEIGKLEADCIILPTGLGTITNPVQALSAAKRLIKQDGIILTWSPNAEYYQLIYRLIKGDTSQEYSRDDWRIDQMRRYTLSDIHRIIESSKLYIESIIPRILSPETAKTFTSISGELLAKLNVDNDAFYNRVSPIDYIIRVSPQKIKPIIIKGLMLKPQAGLQEVRMIQPLARMSSLPGVKVELSHEALSLGAHTKDSIKIMIWQRQLLTYADSLRMIKSAMDNGYIIIADFDDDPDHWPSIAREKFLNFTGVHAVQVSTKPLQQQITQYNKETKVFENHLPEIDYIDVNEKWRPILERKSPITVFFGALNRENEYREEIEAINAAISKNPDLWQFQIVHDRNFFKQLKTNNKTFTPTCDYRTYAKILKKSHIAYLPLKDTPFNRKKSDLKFIEAAGAGTASIASPVIYSGSIQNNKTGFIYRSPNELKEILVRISEHPNLAAQACINANQWVKNNRLLKSYLTPRIKWYHDLWERRFTLNQQLLERVPELTNL